MYTSFHVVVLSLRKVMQRCKITSRESLFCNIYNHMMKDLPKSDVFLVMQRCKITSRESFLSVLQSKTVVVS